MQLTQNQQQTGWMYWLITSAGVSTISSATTAATDTFLRTLVSPAITGTAIAAGWTASIAMSGILNLAALGVSAAANGVTFLWNQRTQQPAPRPIIIEAGPDANLTFQ